MLGEKDIQVHCRTYKETIEEEDIQVGSAEKKSIANIARKGIFNGVTKV